MTSTNAKGFTLLELMIVVAIVAILAAIAMPAYKGYIQKSKVAELVTVLEKEEVKVGLAYSDSGSFDHDSRLITLNNYDTSDKFVGTKYVNSVNTTSSGVITVTGSSDLNSVTLTATPRVNADDGDILTWTLSGTAVDNGLVNGVKSTTTH